MNGKAIAQQRQATVVLGVAVAVLVVAAVVIALTRSDGDEQGLDGGPPHVVLDPVPDNLTLTNAFTGPADVTIFDTGSVLIYGDTGLADPLGGPVLLSTTVIQEGAAPASGEPVTVQGIEGTLYASLGRGGLVASWPSAPDRLQILTSIGLGREQLLAAAAGVIGEEGEIDAGALPAGFGPIGSDTFTALTSFGRGFMLDGEGSGTLSYSDLAAGTELVVSSGPGADARVGLLRPFLDDLRNVDVGGTLALAGIAEGSPAISWMLGDTVVRVTGLGYTLAELVAVVADIRPASDEEFAAIVGEFLATS